MNRKLETLVDQEHIPDIFSLRKSISHKNQNYWIERLVNELPLFISKSEASVHPRSKFFNLDNLTSLPSFKIQKGSESEWEGWCLNRWSIRHGINIPNPIEGAWHRLVACQVPLEPRIYKRPLLTADLVGISVDGFPVIVELKGHTKQTTVLSIVLQALDYGIRLRKSWHYFFEEWRVTLSKYKWPMWESYPHRIYLVCAAPSDVWERERQTQFVPDSTLYIQFKKALDSCGFPLSLVCLSKKTVDKVGFRVVAEVFDLFPNL